MSQVFEQSLGEHLDELARRLRVIVVVLVLSTFLIATIPSNPVLFIKGDTDEYRPLVSDFMSEVQEDLLPENVTLIAYSWLDTFYVYILIAFVLSFILTLPLTGYQVYKYISPALFENERKGLFFYVSSFSILFLFGAMYSYYLLVPFTLKALYRFVYQSNVLPLFSVKDFFNLVGMGILASGIFYTSPLTLFYLVRQNFISVDELTGYRKQIIVGLLIFAAILTPDPTPLSMLLMAVPFYLIFEFTILLLKRITKKKIVRDKDVQLGAKLARELLESPMAIKENNKD